MIIVLYILGIFIFTASIFPVVRKGYGAFTTFMFVCAFLCSVLYSLNAPSYREVMQLPWFRAGEFSFQFTITSDQVIIILLPFITLIAALVSLYSVAYFKEEKNQSRYFSVLSLFMFSMTGLIISGNLFFSFFCWELVGICSYLLIGFYREKQSSGIAATKSLIINKIGDIGFLIALLTFASETESFELIHPINDLSTGSQYLIGAGLLTAVVAKSAQFPLNTWLPDAMAGPSPVSALIHSATMVAAGVYLLFRTRFLFPDEILLAGGILGTITAFIGGWNALAENKIKLLLAWSTMSQLGLMLLSVTIGNPGAAIMHLVSHGFFKAGLFLCAGYLLKSGDAPPEEELKWISNLKSGNRRIAFSILIFLSGLAGVPLTAAFISKEAMAAELPSFAIIPFFIITALTILYTVRLTTFILPYFKNSVKKSLDRYTISVMTLLFFTGWWIWSPEPFRVADYLKFSGTVSHSLTIFSVTFIAIFTVLSFLLMKKFPDSFNRKKFRKIDPDPVYRIIILEPILRTSTLIGRTDRAVLDFLIHMIAYLQVITAHLIASVDRYIVDGITRGIAGSAVQTGKLISIISRGNIQSYLWWSLSILILILIILS